MYTIYENIIYEVIIKNSRFITLLIKINDSSDIDNLINNIKRDYPDATHYCYAYILSHKKKCDDDGEPTGTAGMPILKVLENNDLTNILCVTIRYFGGIKLGANGLIRAYTKGPANAIKKAKILTLIDGVNVDITFDYSRVKEIDYLLNDSTINSKDFSEVITYNVDMTNELLDTISSYNFKYKVNKNIKLEK